MPSMDDKRLEFLTDTIIFINESRYILVKCNTTIMLGKSFEVTEGGPVFWVVT